MIWVYNLGSVMDRAHAARPGVRFQSRTTGLTILSLCQAFHHAFLPVVSVGASAQDAMTQF